MALTPESSPSWQGIGSLKPANTITPQTAVTYDAAGIPHQAYVAALPTSFRAVSPSDTVALPTGVQGLRFATAQTTLSVKGINDTTAVAIGPQAAGTTLAGAFAFVMATGTAPGTGIVAVF